MARTMGALFARATRCKTRRQHKLHQETRRNALRLSIRVESLSLAADGGQISGVGGAWSRKAWVVLSILGMGVGLAPWGGDAGEPDAGQKATAAEPVEPTLEPGFRDVVDGKIREQCKDPDVAAQNQEECKRFLPPEGEGIAVPPRNELPSTAANVHLGLCKTSAANGRPPCRCSDNRIDAVCTFRICGFIEGYFTHPELYRLAGDIAYQLQEYDDDEVAAFSFRGFADGTRWGKNRSPKPEDKLDEVASCLSNAIDFHRYDFASFNVQDRLDAELALLRGCGLEVAMKSSSEAFKFNVPPSYSFSGREIGKSNAKLRSAEFEFTIIDGCGRISQ